MQTFLWPAGNTIIQHSAEHWMMAPVPRSDTVNWDSAHIPRRKKVNCNLLLVLWQFLASISAARGPGQHFLSLYSGARWPAGRGVVNKAANAISVVSQSLEKAMIGTMQPLAHPHTTSRHHMPAIAATTIPQLSFNFQRPHRPDFDLNWIFWSAAAAEFAQ